MERLPARISTTIITAISGIYFGLTFTLALPYLKAFDILSKVVSFLNHSLLNKNVIQQVTRRMKVKTKDRSSVLNVMTWW